MHPVNSRTILRPRDCARTTAFYRDVLGLAIAREFPGGTVFFCGQGYLEVSGQADEGPGDTALWFQVTDLAATHRELVARGAEVVREPRCEPWGLHEMWLRDPDGVRIVVVQVPEEHPIRRDTRTPE